MAHFRVLYSFSLLGILFAQAAYCQEGQYDATKPNKIAERKVSDAAEQENPDTCDCKHAAFSKFTTYEPNYFITSFKGDDFGQVKFKISFKYDLGWPLGKHVGDRLKQRDRIYFAYTQQSFWDIWKFKESSPMRDVNYAPMLHLEHSRRRPFIIDDIRHAWGLSFNDYKIGFLHESNGQDGDRNRSSFKAYTHLTFTITHPVQNKRFNVDRIVIKPWLWKWVGLADQNQNLADYRAYGQLITYINFDWNRTRESTGVYPLELSNVLIPGVYISTVTSIIFNPFLKRKGADWIPNLYVQFWHGYGESLLNYDNRYSGYNAENIFRAGVQFRFL